MKTQSDKYIPKESISKEITAPIIYSNSPILENDKAVIWEISDHDYEVWMKLTYSTGKKKDQLIEPSDEDFGVKAWVAYSLAGAKHIFNQITEGKRKITPMVEDKEITQETPARKAKIKIVSGDTGEILKIKKPKLSSEQKAEMKAVAYEFIKSGITNAKQLSAKGFDIVFCWQILRQYKKENPGV